MRALRKAEEEEKLRERPTTGTNLLINLMEAFFRYERRIATKFGTHVRIETRLALT